MSDYKGTMKRCAMLSLLAVIAVLLNSVVLPVAADPVEPEPILLPSWWLAPAPSRDVTPPPPDPAAVIDTPADAALQRIEPSLRAVARSGGETEVRVLVVVDARAQIDLSAHGHVLTDVELDPLGVRHVTLVVPADLLSKLASLPGVVAVTDTGPRPAPEPPDLNAPGNGPESYAAPERYDVHHYFENDYTGVYQTWSLGVTGQGDPANPVRVAIIDSGVDFANVALRGRWAVQPASGTPYDGWPIAFDDRSMGDWATDPGRAWAAGGAGNWGWYANTAYTITTAAFPLADPSGYPITYTLPPVTSTSGIYHFGYHPDPYWPRAYGFPVGLIVVDSLASGAYDTVCVDLDVDGAFETCMDQYPPAGPGTYGPVGGVDQTGDGEWDLSAGLVYWVDDGVNPPPGADWLYGGDRSPHGPGSLVAFMLGSYYTSGGNHGTLCASAAAGYDGMGGAGIFDDMGRQNPFLWTPGTPIVAGPGSGGADAVPAIPAAGLAGGADIIALGNFYAGGNSLNYYLFTQFGYDGQPDTGDEAQIVSMSFDDGAVDADAWDFPSRYLAWLNLTYGGPVYVSSTGNGGPGYGTVNTPAPATRVAVGASTQYGPYDVYGTYEGIRNGRGAPNWWDVEPWSNRGPSAMSTVAPDVVCNGSSSSGATVLNGLGNGTRAWTLWGGTSRSTPVCAGLLALIYDAYHAAHGRYPTWYEARTLLMNGAADLGYDEQVAGAGAGYALRPVLVAGGQYGITVDPARYEAGIAHAGPGERYQSFAHGLYPGQSDVVTFTLRNPGAVSTTVTLEDEWLRQVGRQTFTLTTRLADVVSSTNRSLGAPDYAVDLTPWVEAHPAADLMVVRVAYPFEHFGPDPHEPPAFDQVHRALIYNWWDDGDGIWWDDGRGVITGRVEMSPTTGLTHELDLDD
ncbi:MAG: S8 family serine peptidase, partial [Anaerolineae bacterium]